MTPDLRLLSGFARGVSLSLHVRVTCLHSGSWLLSGLGVGRFNTRRRRLVMEPLVTSTAAKLLRSSSLQKNIWV